MIPDTESQRLRIAWLWIVGLTVLFLMFAWMLR